MVFTENRLWNPQNAEKCFKHAPTAHCLLAPMLKIQVSTLGGSRGQPEPPFLWQGGPVVRHDQLHGPQCSTSLTLQDRAVQSCFCLMTPPTKAVSLMRTHALEAVWNMQEPYFFLACPKVSPTAGWFGDYVYQTASWGTYPAITLNV